MSNAKSLQAYWWCPRREIRAFAPQVVLKSRMWIEMTRHGGLPLYNFGDELSGIVIREATGRRPVWTPARRAEMFGVGSILHLYRDSGSDGLIWGSGIRRDPGAYASIRPEKLLAVRGALTRDAITNANSTPLGDPGLLVRSIFNRRRQRSGVLVIPHFSVFASRHGRGLLTEYRKHVGKVIPPSTAVTDVMMEVSKARHVITSSLHGVVVAHALGVPATLLNFTESSEPTFKYDDYFSAYGKRPLWFSAVECLNDERRRAAEMHAQEELTAIDSRIDSLIEGLLKSARPLV